MSNKRTAARRQARGAITRQLGPGAAERPQAGLGCPHQRLGGGASARQRGGDCVKPASSSQPQRRLHRRRELADVGGDLGQRLPD
jgi:hypothetical protein